MEAACWLLDWFKQRGPVPGSDMEEKLRCDYFDENLIDSLGVIELIADMEEHFGIHFSQEYFQDRRFSTIGGLSDLIAELSDSREGKSTDGR